MSLINYYMSAVAFLGSCGYYLQAYRIFKRKSAKDLSFPGYSISLFSSVNWLVYGIMIKDIPLISSGIISTLGAGLVTIGILKYGLSRSKV